MCIYVYIHLPKKGWRLANLCGLTLVFFKVHFADLVQILTKQMGGSKIHIAIGPQEDIETF